MAWEKTGAGGLHCLQLPDLEAGQGWFVLLHPFGRPAALPLPPWGSEELGRAPGAPITHTLPAPASSQLLPRALGPFARLENPSRPEERVPEFRGRARAGLYPGCFS